MIQKATFVFALICATIFACYSAYYTPTRQRGFYTTRQRRLRRPLDTSFVDTARKAIMAMLTENGAKVNSKFTRAINDIEKTLATLQGHGRKYKYDAKNIAKFREITERAAKSGDLESFRQALGRAMFANLTEKANEIKNKAKVGSSSEKTSALLDGAKAFLKDIKKKIGDDSFNELISINGEVTLVFVMDTTGSMGGDIKAAKAVVTEIIKYEREIPVSFILSPFNDPDVGPITFRDTEDLKLAVRDIAAIRVKGGGDCPEMAFEGILQALYYGPMPGSAMYVFTDASPKDDTEDNIETVKALAIDLGIPIYFFTKGDCDNLSLRAFKSVAQDTGGFMFELQSDRQIEMLSNFVKQNLKGGATLAANNAQDTNKDNKYKITVDDSIRTLVVTITVSNPSDTIKFIAPHNLQHNITKTDLELVVIFEVTNPTPGTWTLVVPLEAGDHDYSVKTICKVNIDFSHYYFKYVPRNDEKHLPVNHPLLGKDALVMITISEMNLVDSDSLHLKVIYKNGIVGGNYKLHKVGDSGERFRATIRPQKGPYKLELGGKTKTGHLFTRLAQTFDEAKPFRLRVVFARKYTLPLGRNSTLILKIDNFFKEKTFFNVTDSFGYALYPEPQGFAMRYGQSSVFKLKFHVPANDRRNINKTNRVVIKLIGEESGIASTRIVHLLVTPD